MSLRMISWLLFYAPFAWETSIDKMTIKEYTKDANHNNKDNGWGNLSRQAITTEQ